MRDSDELAKLENKIATARARGEKWVRTFWQVTLVFAFLCFSWLFFLPKVNGGTISDSLPIAVIIVFGIVVVAVLVAGDTLFFNKAFHWEQELEEELSSRAATLLGKHADAVSLRRAAKAEEYVLTVTSRRDREIDERITLETPQTIQKYRLQAATFQAALNLIESHRDRLTRI